MENSHQMPETARFSRCPNNGGPPPAWAVLVGNLTPLIAVGLEKWMLDRQYYTILCSGATRLQFGIPQIRTGFARAW